MHLKKVSRGRSPGPPESLEKVSKKSFRTFPCPSFPCFFGKMPGKPPKKQGFFIPTEPLKSLEKKGKTLKKTRNSSHGKKQGIPKKKTRKGRRGFRDLFQTLPTFSRLFPDFFRVSQARSARETPVNGQWVPKIGVSCRLPRGPCETS